MLLLRATEDRPVDTTSQNMTDGSNWLRTCLCRPAFKGHPLYHTSSGGQVTRGRRRCGERLCLSLAVGFTLTSFLAFLLFLFVDLFYSFLFYSLFLFVIYSSYSFHLSIVQPHLSLVWFVLPATTCGGEFIYSVSLVILPAFWTAFDTTLILFVFDLALDVRYHQTTKTKQLCHMTDSGLSAMVCKCSQLRRLSLGQANIFSHLYCLFQAAPSSTMPIFSCFYF